MTEQASQVAIELRINTWFMSLTETTHIVILHCTETEVVYEEQCVDSCPASTYYHANHNECLSTCTALILWENDMMNCVTTCPERHTADPNGNECTLSSCAEGKYLSSEEYPKRCYSCDITCLACDGPSPQECLTCPQSMFYQYDQTYNTRKCLGACSLGFL